ncbi:MAG: homoserine kinase [Gammaproteobacteria bacterium]|nr:homoserine kinase [Gammaproteobacteria bacterium]
MSIAHAFAPASVGNVAVGFDVLGLAIAGPGDRCSARRTNRPGVEIASIRGLAVALPTDPERNTAARSAASLLAHTGVEWGVVLELEKGIPLGSGMGGSAASAVAAVCAVNALLDEPLPTADLLVHALAGESLASGGRAHADNVAPALLGGLTIAQHAEDRWYMRRLPVPSSLRCVLVHPELEVATRTGRALLADHVPMDQVVEQISATAGFVAGCLADDIELIGRSLRDPIVEPQRAHLVRGFTTVQSAALEQGALGCSLSGSGPSMFAFARPEDADRIAGAMQAGFAAHGIASDAWISELDTPGATAELVT